MNKHVALFEVKEVKEPDSDPNGEFEAILSVPVVDRDGEVIDAGAFDPLPAEIPIHKFHDFSSPVATAAPFYDGEVLKARGTFDPDPESQAIRQKVGRSIRYMSVGFMAASRQDVDGVPHITKAELLEASFVSIPSNREAAITAVKSMLVGEKGPELFIPSTKAGRTLSAKNEGLLRQAVTIITDVLKQLEEAPDPEPAKGITDPEDAAAPAAAPPADVTVKHQALLAEAELVLLDCAPARTTQGVTTV